MALASLALLAAFLVTLTSLALFIVSDWRWSIALLAAQYMGVFLLVATQWPPAMAVTKLIAGWIAGAVLGMALNQGDFETARRAGAASDGDSASVARRAGVFPAGERLAALRYLASGHAFYLLAAILVSMVVFSVVERLLAWIPGLGLEAAWGGLILIGMGLLKLGFTDQPLQATLGLLTLLSGFEILYAAAQDSLLVAGLLAGVNLAIALVGAYLLVAPYIEVPE